MSLVPMRSAASNLPALVATGGEQAARRFFDFFTSNIRNRHTREAYGRAANGISTVGRERQIVNCPLGVQGFWRFPVEPGGYHSRSRQNVRELHRQNPIKVTKLPCDFGLAFLT
jgi:hypothetical protein